MEIYLIRHTKVNCENNVCYGQSDLDLADSYQDELNALRQKLNWNNNENVAFFSSPLKRCKILAKNLAYQPVTIDNRIMEINFGEWELKKWDEINSAHYNRWCTDFVYTACPSGESFLDLYTRSKNFFEEIISYQNNFDMIAIITHAGVIKSILSQVLEMKIEKAFSIRIDYGGISKIKLDRNLKNIEYINR